MIMKSLSSSPLKGKGLESSSARARDDQCVMYF